VGESRGAFQARVLHGPRPFEQRHAAFEHSAGGSWRGREGLVLVHRRQTAIAVGRMHMERFVGHGTDHHEQSIHQLRIRRCSRASRIAFSQPLLKDRKIDAARQHSSSRSETRTAPSFVPGIRRSDRGVRQGGVLDAQGHGRERHRSAALARARPGAGPAEQDPRRCRSDSPLDLVQAEAEVAPRRENLIRANTTTEDAEDRLRRAHHETPPTPRSGGRASIRLRRPTGRDSVPDVDAAVASALNERIRPRARRPRSGECEDERGVPHQSEAAGRARRDVVSRQRPRRHAVPPHRRVSRHRHRDIEPQLRGRARPGIHPRLSHLELWRHRELPLGRSYEQASLARAEVERRQVGAADREPSTAGRGDGPSGGQASEEHGRTGRCRARRRKPGGAAFRRGAAALRGGTLERPSLSRRLSATCCKRR